MLILPINVILYKMLYYKPTTVSSVKRATVRVSVADGCRKRRELG